MAEKEYESVKITDGCWRIEDDVVRAFLITGDEKALLIDTGFGNGDIKKAVSAITDLPVILINTHGDDDHTGCNQAFGKVLMHPSEFAFYHSAPGPKAQVIPVWEGETIDLGGRQLEVILLPGHTPGSIALLDRGNRMIFTGDSVSETPVFMFGDMRDIEAYIYSMEKLVNISNNFDAIYPSHGPCPVKKELVDKLLRCAKSVIAGQVSPQEPPFPMPAQMYLLDGVGFFYDGK